MTTNIDRAIAGAAGAPLSREQKGKIAMLSRKAWERFGRPGAAPGVTGGKAAAEAFRAWRLMQDGEACGKGSLRAATNADYPLLKAHFLRMLGYTATADRMATRAAMDPSQQALAKLRHEMEGAQDVIERPAQYIAAIARCKFKTTDLESLSAKQLWVLVFDIRRSAQKRRTASLVPF